MQVKFDIFFMVTLIMRPYKKLKCSLASVSTWLRETTSNNISDDICIVFELWN